MKKKSKTKLKRKIKKLKKPKTKNPDVFGESAKMSLLNSFVGTEVSVRIPIGKINSASISDILMKPELPNSSKFRLFNRTSTIDFDPDDVSDVSPNGVIWIKKFQR